MKNMNRVDDSLSFDDMRIDRLAMHLTLWMFATSFNKCNFVNESVNLRRRHIWTGRDREFSWLGANKDGALLLSTTTVVPMGTSRAAAGVCMYVCMCVCVCVFARARLCMCVCSFVCMHAYVHVFSCTHS